MRVNMTRVVTQPRVALRIGDLGTWVDLEVIVAQLGMRVDRRILGPEARDPLAVPWAQGQPV